MAALEAGFAYAEQHLAKRDPYWVEPLDKTAGMILIEGNAAGALGCMMAGVTVVAWYPITPSSSLPETLIGYMKKYRMDPETGKATYAIVQAEDEIASIGMVIGAGWAGARAMTSTSGPGISLMGEFAGLAYYAEVPGVVFDIQRVGPSTGLPTRTAQGDILATALLSHGDTKQIMLLPASVEECYTMAMDAFDLAERFQTLVFVMSDLDLGMNTWMSPAVPVSRTVRSIAARSSTRRRWRGSASGAATRTSTATAFRIAAFPASRCRRTSRAVRATTRRRSTASGPTTTCTTWIGSRASSRPRASTCRKPVVDDVAGAEVGIIGYGTSHWAIDESRDQLEPEAGIKTAYLRLRAYPFTDELTAVHRSLRAGSTSSSRTATRRCSSLMRLELPPSAIAKLRSVLHYNGLPIDARSITDDILEQEGVKQAGYPS